MARSKENSSGLSRDEQVFLGKLQAARKLRTHAKEAEEVWLKLGRKEGLDVEKVVKVLNEEEARFRREHPDRVIGA